MRQLAPEAILQRSVRPPLARQRGSLLGLSFIAAAVVCVTGLLTGGVLGLALTSVATLFAAWITFFLGRTLLPTSLCFGAVVCVYGSQSLAQLLLALYNQTRSPAGGWGMDLADHSGALALGHCSLLAGSLLAVSVLRAFVRRARRPSIDLARHSTTPTRVVLIIALLLYVARPVLRLALSTHLAWLVDVLTEDLEAVGFFVGWFAGDFGAVTNVVVLGALLVSCVIGALLGTRYPIVILGLYAVGRLVSPHERHRRRLIMTTLVALVPTLMFFSLVGDVRLRRGRDSLDLLGVSRLGDFDDAVAVSRSDDQAKDRDPILSALRRLYAWPNAASVSLTPDPIPYRGFGHWLADCLPYLQVGTWGADAPRQFFESGFGTHHASDYGFPEEFGATVEFGVLADGWSTAGPLGVFVLGFIVAFVLCMSEHLVLCGLRLSYAGKLVLLCILLKGCIQCYVYPAQLVIRYVVIYTCFWASVVGIMDVLSGHYRGMLRHHSRSGMARTGLG